MRKGAIDALSEMKITDPKIINSISLLLTDTVEAVRGKAADALRNIGKEAIPVLIEKYVFYSKNYVFHFIIPISNKKMQILIISAIGGIGEEAKDALPFVIERLTDKRKLIRVEAARTLGRIGKESELAAVALFHALTDKKSLIRKEAALALGKVGYSAGLGISSLIITLRDKNPDVRWRASDTLGIIGESFSDILKGALELDDKEAIFKAVELLRIGIKEIVSGLTDLRQDKCDYVCEAALNALDTLTEE